MIQGTYYKEWSTVLGREMEFKVYGHARCAGAGTARPRRPVFMTGRTTECPTPLPSC